MAELFQAEARELTGSANTRRLRRAGMVPAILYGQGKDVVHLSIPESQVNSAVRNNQPYIQLEGASTESAQIQELQWDALGSTVLHVDLTRMDANAMIEVELTISLTGDAGAAINQVIRTTTAVVPAMNIPNGLVADISSLNDGDSISLGDIELPEKVSLLSDPSTVVVTCGAVATPETPAEEATVAEDTEDAEDAGNNETEESGGDE
ncbi:MAG: 50S ribosomal protein L25 [Pirellulaceae bacterium]